MLKKYPQSLHCRFEDFPDKVRVLCGLGFQDVPDSAYQFGSRVILQRTPNCGEVQGDYTEGEDLPAYAMIFSDTGSDDTFGLKLSFYGWGTFFIQNPGDAYYTLEVLKGLKVESGSLSKSFELTDVWETRLPVTYDTTTAPTTHVVIPVMISALSGVGSQGTIGITFDPAGNPFIAGTGASTVLVGVSQKDGLIAVGVK